MTPNGRVKRPLSDLADYVNGRAFKQSEWGKQGLPIIRIAQLTNPSAKSNYFSGEDVDPRHRVNDGDLLFSWSATLAVVKWSGGPAVLNQHIFKVTERPGVDRDFLGHLLVHSIPSLAEESHGSTMKHIRNGVLDGFNVWVPPLPEQRKIAVVLSSIDDTIARTEDVIEQIRVSQGGLLRQLLSEERWPVVTLDAACEFLDGRRIPVKAADRQKMTGGIPYYGASGIIDWVNESIFDEPLVLLAEDGANILTRNSPVAFKVAGRCWVNNHAHVLRPRDGWDHDFIVECLESLDYRNYSTGTAQPKLNQEVCRKIVILRPTSAEQARIGDFVRSINDRSRSENSCLLSLRELKEALVMPLMSGELRVNPDEAVA